MATTTLINKYDMISQNILLTTDCVILFFGPAETEILLVKRKSDPYKGLWALPGGFVEDNEALEEGAKRELEEETGLMVEELHQIGAFGAPGRDPRGRTVTIAYWATITSRVKVKGSDDAEEADWFSVSKLPALAFDHREIIKEALLKIIFSRI